MVGAGMVGGSGEIVSPMLGALLAASALTALGNCGRLG